MDGFRALCAGVGPLASPGDDDRYREQEDVILLLVVNLDAPGIAEPEPLLGDARDILIAALDGELEIEKVANRFQIVRTAGINRETTATEKGQHITLDVGQQFAV